MIPTLYSSLKAACTRILSSFDSRLYSRRILNPVGGGTSA